MNPVFCTKCRGSELRRAVWQHPSCVSRLTPEWVLSGTLHGIPDAAHNYVVSGRTPLAWAVDRLHIRQDRESGIVNDPNAWFAADPARLISHLQRLVHVSVETHRLVKGLPPALQS